MRYLIGVDDTDDKDSRGTGFRTRDLTSLIHSNNLGKVSSISRHQLLVHPEIPFTSHNSSACMDVEIFDIESFTNYCKDYLIKESAPSSDVGLCIAPYNHIKQSIIDWGLRAKKEILSQNEALKIANHEEIYLEGLLGTKGGIIGALAGVGLRKYGNDGRLFWLAGKDLRDYNGIYTASELLKMSNFDKIISIEDKDIEPNHRIFANEWLRPILIENKICIIVEPNINCSEYEWNIASKEYIKSISN